MFGCQRYNRHGSPQYPLVNPKVGKTTTRISGAWMVEWMIIDPRVKNKRLTLIEQESSVDLKPGLAFPLARVGPPPIRRTISTSQAETHCCPWESRSIGVTGCQCPWKIAASLTWLRHIKLHECQTSRGAWSWLIATVVVSILQNWYLFLSLWSTYLSCLIVVHIMPAYSLKSVWKVTAQYS